MPTSQSPEPSLANQVALITGSSGGIGTATARLLASHGCSICLHYNNDSSTSQELEKELEKEYTPEFGNKFTCFQADLGDYEQVHNLHAHTFTTLGPPTILINNAGTTSAHSGSKSLSDIPISVFESTWRVNCGSAYLLTQLCMPAMEDAGYGRVVYVSSVAGLTGGIVGPHYASSKSALHGLIHWAANAYAKQGITVNGVAPALIEDTKMLPGSSEELAKKIPLGRLGRPEEIADTILWMVRTGYVTNKIVAVDGGMFPQH